MPNASSVPTQGSEFGKYSFAKTRPVTVEYRKKSYHSIAVPMVEATTARRNCFWCSESESGALPRSMAAMTFSPARGIRAIVREQTRGFGAGSRREQLSRGAAEEDQRRAPRASETMPGSKPDDWRVSICSYTA